MKILASAFALALLSSTGFAAPISSDADPSLAGGTIVDFESGPSGTYVTQNVGALGITALSSTYAPTPSFGIDSDFAGDYNTRGQFHITNYGSNFQVLRFDFGSATSAFGFLFGASDSSWVLDAYNGSGLLDSLVINPVFASNAGDFFGLSGLAGATYAVLTQNQDGAYAGGGVDYVFVDNFTYVSGTVPEPASLALLGFALAGMAGLRRTKAA